MRRRLASKVFATLSQYDGAIASYFGGLVSAGAPNAETTELPAECNVTLSKVVDLRYGENPHQRAAFYESMSNNLTLFTGPKWEQLGGKELSYNNMLDLDAGMRLLSDLPTERTTVAILKH
jgi:phosphoribosylaminoimidazolecarboxamide formyltransferase/IMP cyclohydrolase